MPYRSNVLRRYYGKRQSVLSCLALTVQETRDGVNSNGPFVVSPNTSLAETSPYLNVPWYGGSEVCQQWREGRKRNIA